MKEKTKHSISYIICCVLLIFLSGILFYSIYLQYHKMQISISKLDFELENQKQLLAALQKKERVQSYLLEDIRSRLEMANFELTSAYDVKSAVYLLRIAESMIKKAQDPTLFKLKELISKKIIDLQALPILDAEDILLRVEKISNEIEGLPIIATQIKPVESLVVDDEKSAWKRFLIAVMQTLKESIVIRYHVLPAKPLLLEAEQAYLVANIRSQLAQASWAVLHKQPVIYEHAISQTITWIKQYYREDIEAVQDVLQRLNALQKIDVRPVLPDITDALKQLDEFSI